MSTTRCNKITTRCSLSEYVRDGLPYTHEQQKRAPVSQSRVRRYDVIGELTMTNEHKLQPE